MGFARDVLGLDLWHRQEELVSTVARSPRVACRSGHKCGKSTACVAIALWFVCTRSERARVILTAPGDRQVRKILWKELRRVAMPLLALLGGATLGLDPATGMRWPDGREVIGFSTSSAENIAGFSSPEMLWVVDEASGYPQALYDAIEGNRAGGDEDIGAEARIVLISNPTQTTGEFFDAFHTKREFYALVHISSEESPNVTGKGPVIRGLATRAYVQEKKKEWGEDSPRYQVRVRGNFPKESSGAVIGIGLVEAGRARYHDLRARHAELEDPLVLGVDVARFGDDESAFCPRRGNLVYPLEVVHGFDTMAVAARAVAIAKKLRHPWETVSFHVDGNGVGAGVVDYLRLLEQEPDSWVRVCEVNASSKATDEEAFYNLRSQLWFGVRQFLSEGGSLPPEDAALETELLAPVYTFDPRGRQRVESKDDIKEKIQRSPDRADALGLSVYNPPRDDLSLASAGSGHVYRIPGRGY